ncbi:MAG: energy transducer TonB [Alphaproteobacteria bacterium]|nr:energy transducer TonB [Alphaproteobacteria bacterium]MBU0864561.1 energy transducer TonB [Alphaproteobacteria bacterium]MBU1825897.1 energy transducer TonB [Alphaproteobacteria bacterium]
MAYTGQISRQQRLASGSAALLAVVAVGFGLANGLDLGVVRKVSQAIAALAIPAPPPPDVVVPQAVQSDTMSGKASAANQYAKAAPVAAPKAKLPPITPPIAAAPQPGAGNDALAGATSNPGAGSGAGGRGDGIGAGGSGSGTGGGSKAVWQSGTIRDRDYPAAASRARVGGEVEVRFTIESTGRVTGCRVSRSSGDAALDATTCRLIEERFRFKPATNAAGDAVASAYGWRQTWWLEPRR